MARIRTIKPEFFTSEEILELDPLARLFFIGLWCEADREGRLPWKLKTLKMRYLPSDDCDISILSDQLIEQKLIVIYEVDGKEYCEITGFTKHQVINNRERESEIPARVNDASSTRESGREGKEGKGREGKSRATRSPNHFEVTEELKDWASKSQITINLITETDKFLDYHRSKGSAFKDWDAAWRTWMRKAQEFLNEKITPIDQNRPRKEFGA